MRTQFFIPALLIFSLAIVSVCSAGVVVIQNTSPGATSWPGSPMASTVANPSTTSVTESFNGGGGCTNYSQTFSVTTSDYILDKISIYAGGGSGTSPTTNLILKLFDLGFQAAPNPSPYASAIVGPNQLGSGAGLSVTYVNQTLGILEFDFTGADEVVLTNGHVYAFELVSGLNTVTILWDRGITDTYPGGAAYRNQSWINGNNARDFAMAVYANAIVTTNTTTNAPFVPSGIVFRAFSKPSNGINQEGANPASGLLFTDGVLCGTTVNGGSQGVGTAFYISPDGSRFSSFRSFASSADPANPYGNLIGTSSRFFGTSFGGGTSGVGSIFVGQTNGSVSIIRSFTTVSKDNATNSGGAAPGASLVSSGGTLFGAATAGGTNANGTLFSLTTNGSAFSVLHNFTAMDCGTGTNTDGAAPWGNLILSGDTLYGTASAGGPGGNGVVFSVKTNGTGFTALHSFAPMDPLTATNADGAIPYGGLILLSNILCGTTSAGGYGGSGTVFALNTNGTGFVVLHHFSAINPVSGTNSDGASPCAALTAAGSFLYGAASAGGAAANGTVFSVNTGSSQFSTLHSFSPMLPGGTNSDGAFPVGSLVLQGNALYGTAFSGGPAAGGIVFSIPLTLPALIKIASNTNGAVTLYFSTGPGSTNIVQATTNLLSPILWQNIFTNIADDSGEWQLIETNTVIPWRYYRSFIP